MSEHPHGLDRDYLIDEEFPDMLGLIIQTGWDWDEAKRWFFTTSCKVCRTLGPNNACQDCS